MIEEQPKYSSEFTKLTNAHSNLSLIYHQVYSFRSKVNEKIFLSASLSFSNFFVTPVTISFSCFTIEVFLIVISSQTFVFTSSRSIISLFIVPTPLEGGGNYILKWVFFVQSILTDRYIHSREL